MHPRKPYVLQSDGVSSRIRGPREPSRIVVCDDDTGLRELLCDILRDQRYRTESCEDGVEALESIRRESAAVLITDLDMPRMSGEELCERVRAMPDGARMAIIAISGFTRARLRGAQGRFDLRLQKPIDLAALLDYLDAETGATKV